MQLKSRAYTVAINSYSLLLFTSPLRLPPSPNVITINISYRVKGETIFVTTYCYINWYGKPLGQQISPSGICILHACHTILQHWMLVSSGGMINCPRNLFRFTLGHRQLHKYGSLDQLIRSQPMQNNFIGQIAVSRGFDCKILIAHQFNNCQH